MNMNAISPEGYIIAVNYTVLISARNVVVFLQRLTVTFRVARGQLLVLQTPDSDGSGDEWMHRRAQNKIK